MNAHSLTAALKEEALRLGFDLAGATAAVASTDFDRFEAWLADGCAGEMRYFANRLDAYRHPSGVLEGVKSILMLAANYRSDEPADAGPGQARISRHAWGADYHEVLRSRLHKLAQFHRRLVPMARARGVVDTAPLFERRNRPVGRPRLDRQEHALDQRRAWAVGSSWLRCLTTEELEYDEPMATDRCGACRACLDACPTGASSRPTGWTRESASAI